MEYSCDQCGMGVKDITCAKCGKELVPDTVTVEGKKINVATCPNGCGKIKSPMCCGHDMQAQEN